MWAEAPDVSHSLTGSPGGIRADTYETSVGFGLTRRAR